MEDFTPPPQVPRPSLMLFSLEILLVRLTLTTGLTSDTIWCMPPSLSGELRVRLSRAPALSTGVGNEVLYHIKWPLIC